MHAKEMQEILVVDGSRPFDLMDEDEQIDVLISALRKHGKVVMPMGDRFEQAVNEIRLETTTVTLPYYT
ncbi:MAG: hypothetical protein HQK89_10615 [Nitrospirae bacterium]|nr:hypothetical protein [Nitrospirota bacterium]